MVHKEIRFNQVVESNNVRIESRRPLPDGQIPQKTIRTYNGRIGCKPFESGDHALLVTKKAEDCLAPPFLRFRDRRCADLESSRGSSVLPRIGLRLQLKVHRHPPVTQRSSVSTRYSR